MTLLSAQIEQLRCIERAELELDSRATLITGPNASGKTTVLEFIRHALDRAPRSGTAAAKAADDRIRNLLAANLGTSGYVELEFESQEGLVYQIRRGAHDAPQVIDAAGKPVRPEVLGSSLLVDEAGVRFVDKGLFRAEIALPAEAPIGEYQARIVLFQGGRPVSEKLRTLTVAKVGAERSLYLWAHERPWSYGLAAMAFALGAGWAASRAFRRD